MIIQKMSDIRQNGEICGGESMDKRTKKTKQRIQDAFFDLMKDKPLEEIRVIDICKAADINRSTFYAHYEDMPCLVRSLKDEIADKLLGAFKLYLFDMDTGPMVTALLNSIRENKHLFSLMYHHKQLDVWEKCKQMMTQETIPIWQKESNLSVEELKLLLEYMNEGIFRLLDLWCKGDIGIDTARFQELFDGVVKYGIYNYIYTK